MSATDPVASIRDKGPFRSILVNPQWQFQDDMASLLIAEVSADDCHLYLWTPSASVPQAMELMAHWEFAYKASIFLCKVDHEGDPIPGSEAIEEGFGGQGFWVRGETELLLFGLRGTEGLRHSRQDNFVKWTEPSSIRRIVEECSYGPYLELFPRERVAGWSYWGGT